MDRDPNCREATRDPIFLLQVGTRLFTEFPDGTYWDDDSLCIESFDDLPDWIREFVITEDDWQYIHLSSEFWKVAESLEGSNNFPMVYTEWRTESVFLTRDEAESYGASRHYRWEMWKVYCTPCDGELARILREYDPAVKS